jgi:site-specific recombinase XerD
MVHQRGNSWQADVSIKGHRLRKQFESKELAEAWVKSIREQAQHRNTEPSPSEPLTPNSPLEGLFNFARERWFGTKWASLAIGNARDCIHALGRRKPIKDVNEENIKKLVEEFKRKGLSGATINRKLSALRVILTEAVKLGCMAEFPEIVPEREITLLRVLAEDEEQRLLNALETLGADDTRDLVILLLDIGLTLTEGLRLWWKDVRADVIHVANHHSRSARDVPQSVRVQTMLRDRKKRLVEQVERVFAGLSRQRIEGDWIAAKDESELRDELLTMATLRDTFCVRLCQRGADLLTVQRITGHKSITYTRRYQNYGGLVRPESNLAKLLRTSAELQSLE